MSTQRLTVQKVLEPSAREFLSSRAGLICVATAMTLSRNLQPFGSF
jgi:hypothetical protein